LDEAEAVVAVVGENLFGLELDPRCTQIGAFNLALAAWRRVGHCVLPALNIACSGLAPNAKRADWIRLAGGDDRLERGMARLYALFADAPVLGSLINPRDSEGDMVMAAFHELQPLLERAMAQEADDDAAHEMVVAARGLAKAAESLADRFTLIATNVPYLGRGKQDAVLNAYCEHTYPDAKTDLATCFIERTLAFCAPNCSSALVTPQNWLFLDGYKEYRAELLKDSTLVAVVKLGEHGFQSSQAAGAFSAMLICSMALPNQDSCFVGLDVSARRSFIEKAEDCLGREPVRLNQWRQLKNPDAIIALEELAYENLLGSVASVFVGSQPGQTTRLTRGFWEYPNIDLNQWTFMESSPSGSSDYSGKSELCLTVAQMSRAGITESVIRGKQAWGRRGVLVA